MNLNGVARLYDRLTPRERLPLILSADSRGDRAEVDRLINSMPSAHHNGLIMIHVLALIYISEQLEHALAFHHGLDRLDNLIETGKDPDPFWEFIYMSSAYMFKQNAEGWKQFCAEMSVDPDELVRANYQGFMLRFCLEWMHDVAPSAERLKEAIIGQCPGKTPADIELATADTLRKSWVNMMAEMRGFGSLRANET